MCPGLESATSSDARLTDSETGKADGSAAECERAIIECAQSWADRAKRAEASLTVLRGAIRTMLNCPDCRGEGTVYVSTKEGMKGQRVTEEAWHRETVTCPCRLNASAVLAASRVPHQEDTNDVLTRTGEPGADRPPQPPIQKARSRHMERVEIIFNGRKLLCDPRISYVDALAAAGFGPSEVDRAISVTYSRAASPKPDGILMRGESITAQDGTVINAYDTSNA